MNEVTAYFMHLALSLHLSITVEHFQILQLSLT